jgi:hypothetical protein
MFRYRFLDEISASKEEQTKVPLNVLTVETVAKPNAMEAFLRGLFLQSG